MIIDDQGDYISGSGLGADIPIFFSRYIVHTYHNGARDNVEYGADSLDDAMEWLRGIKARCLSVFKCFRTNGGVWNGGSGSFGSEIRQLSTDVAIVAV